ncbi:MAG: hypothetical protein RL173_80 [Fibrobacterota bacterium]|jgi:hypothetical protein
MHSKLFPCAPKRRFPRILASFVGGVLALSSCQDQPVAPVGPTTYTAKLPEIASLHLRPQSATWKNKADTGTGKLSAPASSQTVEFVRDNPPKDTTEIVAYRAGVKVLSALYKYVDAAELADLKSYTTYPVNTEILRRIYPASDKQTFNATLAKALVDGDKLVDTLEFSSILAGGVDSASVYREAMLYMVSLKKPLDQIVANWSLGLDTSKVKVRIRQLASEGLVTDTSTLFTKYVSVKSPLLVPTMQIGGTVSVQGAFQSDSGLSSLGWKVLQGSVEATGFKLTFSAAVTGAEKTWDLAKNADASLAAGSAVPAGTYTLVVWMTDSKKHSDTARFTFTISALVVADAVPPVVTWVSPANMTTQEHVDSLVSMKVQASDASGIESVTIDGAAATEVDGIWTRSVIVPVNDTGYVVVASAKDKFGNVAVASIRVSRKAKPQLDDPRISLVSPKSGTEIPFETSSVTATWSVVDPVAKIDSVIIDGVRVTSKDSVYAKDVTLDPTGVAKSIEIKVWTRGKPFTSSVTATRLVDKVGPAIVWVDPTSDPILDNKDSSYTVKVKASDLSGVDTVLIDGKPAELVDGIWSRKIEVAVLEKGDSVLVRAVDRKGNESSKAMMFYRKPPVVAGAPVLTLLSPASKTGNVIPVDSAYVVARWKVIDTAAGIDDSMVTISGVRATKEADNFYGAKIALSPNGKDVVVQIRATNRQNLTATDEFRIQRAKDTVAPKLVSIDGSRTVGFDSTSAKVSWKVTDNVGVKSVVIGGKPATAIGDVYAATVNLAGGDNRLVIVAVDSVDNTVSDTVIVTRLVDANKPVILFVKGEQTIAFDETSATISVKVADNRGLKTVTIDGQIVAGTDGLYSLVVTVPVQGRTVTVKAEDLSGNIATDSAKILRGGDNIAPSIVRVSGGGGVVFDITSAELVWKVTDNAQVASVLLDGVAVTGDAGVYTKTVSLKPDRNVFNIVAKDSAGNVAKDSFVVNRGGDLVKPSLVLVSPSKDTTVSETQTSIDITVKATDNNKVTSLTIGGVAVTGTADTYKRSVSLAVGLNTIVVVASDSSGNDSTRTIKVTKSADATSPVLSLKSPSKDTTVVDATSSIVVSATATDNVGVQSVTIGGTAATLTGGVWSATVNLAYGANTFSVVAKDAAGNSTAASLKVTRLDQTAPVVVLANPTKDTTVSDAATTLVVGAVVTDNVGVKSVTIGGKAATLSVGIWSATVNLAYGVNTISVVATDSVNPTTTASVKITRRDQTAPTIVADANTKSQSVAYATTGIVLGWTVSDNVGVTSVTLNGAAKTVAEIKASTVTLVPGGNPFVVVVTDAGGNSTKDSINISRTADASAPTIAGDASTKTQTVPFSTSSIALKWTVSDDVGVASITLNGVAQTVAGTVSSTKNLVVGPNIFVLVATDVSGKSTKDSIVITRSRDAVKPIVMKSAGTSNRTVIYDTASTTVSWTVSDNDVLKSVVIGGTTTPVSGGVYKKTVSLNVGANSFVIAATDTSLNVSYDTVTITRKIPKAMNSPAQGHYLGSIYDTLTSSMADSVQYNLDGITWITAKAPFLINQTRTFQTRAWYKGVATYDTVRYVIHAAKPVLNTMSWSSFYLVGDTLYASGLNSEGGLGVGDNIDRTTPVRVTTGVKSVGQGARHTMIVKTDGTLWMVGRNHQGQLGDGTTISRSTPVQVPGFSNVVAATGFSNGPAASGFNITLFLTSTGDVYGMGSNSIGELGDGTTTERHSPVLIATGASQISAGALHYGILKTDGSLWMVGFNGYGELGDSTLNNSNVPKKVLTGIKSIAAGGIHTLALGLDGFIRTFGDGTSGQTFGVTTGPDATPRKTSLVAEQVYASNYASYYKDASGNIFGAGENTGSSTGMIPTSGDGKVLSPVKIGSNFNSFAVGIYFAIGVTTEGRLVRFGSNDEQVANLFWYGSQFSTVVSPDYTPIAIAAP